MWVLGMVMYDNEFETKENEVYITDKTEPQHTYLAARCLCVVSYRFPALQTQVSQKVWSLTYEEEEGLDPPQNVSPQKYDPPLRDNER